MNEHEHHEAVIAGQGTVGLEIAEDLPDVELILVPLSGGGLAAGVAAAIKGRIPRAHVIGVSMERGAAMQVSLLAGKPVLVEEFETLADSLGGGIGLDNQHTFAMCRDLLDDVVLVSEEEIAEGVRRIGAVVGEQVGLYETMTGVDNPAVSSAARPEATAGSREVDAAAPASGAVTDSSEGEVLQFQRRPPRER